MAIVNAGSLGTSPAVQKKVDTAAKIHVHLEPNGIDGGFDVYMAKEPMEEGSVPPVTKATIYRYRAWLKKDEESKPVKVLFVLSSEGFSIVEDDVETLFKIKAVVKYLFKPEKRMFRFVTKHKTESVTTCCYLAHGSLISHLESTIAKMIQVLLADTGILGTVLHDFESEDEDELNVKRGDKLAILEAFDDGWLLASLDDGTTGMVPQTHVYADPKTLKKAKKHADDKLKRLTMAAATVE